jgi:hypothetical protein
MSAAFTWKDLEPQEGNFDFSQVKEALNWGEKFGKKINIILYAGNKSPEWIYIKGIQSISWKRKWKEDRSIQLNEQTTIETAPLFWDAKYLALWKKLVTKLSIEIKQHPALGYVLITGPTPKDYTTGTVIRYNEDWQAVLSMGYTNERHLSAWKDVIEHYHKVFEDTKLVIALGPLRPGTSDLKLSIGVVDYVAQNRFANIAFLCVVLNDTWFVNSPGAIELRHLFQKAESLGLPFGYQMNYSVNRMSKFRVEENKTILNFSATLDIAVSDGASWIEVWHDDVITPGNYSTPNPAFQSDLIRISKTLMSSR